MHAFALGHHSHDKRYVHQHAPRFVVSVCFFQPFLVSCLKLATIQPRHQVLWSVLTHTINAS